MSTLITETEIYNTLNGPKRVKETQKKLIGFRNPGIMSSHASFERQPCFSYPQLMNFRTLTNKNLYLQNKIFS